MIGSPVANLVVLVLSQALFVSSGSILLALSGVIGNDLSPVSWFSTLPFALMLGVGSFAIVPASLLMLHRGRRSGFALGIACGCASGLISAGGLILHSFWIFCLGMATWGIATAFGQYYRFAASEAVGPERAGAAISWVLAGSVVGVFTGPLIAIHTRNLLPSAEYVASFLVVSLQCIMALILIGFLHVPKQTCKDATGASTQSLPLFTFLRKPSALAGIVNGTVASSVMVLVMTAAPLAIIHVGHMGNDAIAAIQLHLLGMYAPSFVTGYLVDRFGAVRTSVSGLLLLAISLLVAANGHSMLQFNVSMVVLGVGWNLLYVASSVILSKQAVAGERAVMQAASEFSINTMIALSALLAGTVFASLGWNALLVVSTPMLAASLAATFRFAYATDNRVAMDTVARPVRTDMS